MISLKTFITSIFAALVIGGVVGWIIRSEGFKTVQITIIDPSGRKVVIDLKEDSIPYDELLDKIFKNEFFKLGTIGLLKEKYNIFPFDDVELVDKIATLSPYDQVSKGLQELEEKRIGPFGYWVDSVFVGVPSVEDQPPEGFANVCENGKYRGRQIEITYPQTDKKIKVVASGIYACPPGYKYADIQLNFNDANELFGNTPLNKYEKAVALILR